jgi:8-oxo-dGTP diphosphatase
MIHYRSPNLTVDGVLLEGNELLLIQRKHDPFKGLWALPGGFVEYGETTEEAILREMKEETGLIVRIGELVGVYSDPNRDPRGHTVSIVYLVERIRGTPCGGDDAVIAQFFNYESLPALAFDHHKIINDVLRRRS